jgi:hypothetical protein
MAVTASKISDDRDVYSIEYDKDAVNGDTIKATFSNPSDKSVYAGLNDGTFIVTVEKGYKGSDDVLVEGNVGGSDEGEVKFG